MTKTTALRLTVSALTIAGIALFSAGCGGTEENTDPGVATYTLTADGPLCNAPDLDAVFGTTSGPDIHLCRWDCITYHGESRQMVTIQFSRANTSAPWVYDGEKAEPATYCPTN